MRAPAFLVLQTIRRFHHADNKEQNEQGKPYRLYRTVDIDNHIPNRAALELLGRLRNKLPYLSKFVVPSFKAFSRFCTTQLSDNKITSRPFTVALDFNIAVNLVAPSVPAVRFFSCKKLYTGQIAHKLNDLSLASSGF